jgi:MarR family
MRTATKAHQPERETDADRVATLQLVIALGRSVQAVERGVRPHLAECGLGLTEFAVLEVLYHKGAMPLGEIRDRILVTGASTTYVVKKLEGRTDSSRFLLYCRWDLPVPSLGHSQT